MAEPISTEKDARYDAEAEAVRVLSAQTVEVSPIETKNVYELEQPPNGGWRAWTQVLGSFLLIFNAWGFVSSYGGFQYFYSANLLSSHSLSSLSWIGTVEGFLVVFGAILTGPLYDRGFLNQLVLVGSTLFVFGIMMLSLATQYYQVFLAQAVCVGLGSGCLYAPAVAVVATAFTTKRAFAMGVAHCGTALGGIVYPIVFRRLEPKIGFPWATRTMGFIALATSICAFICLQARKVRTSGRSRKLLDFSAFKEPPFIMYCLGLFLIFMPFWVPFFYTPVFAQEVLHTSRDMAYYILAIGNATSFFGRIIPSLIADRFGAIETLIIGIVYAAVLCFAWPAVHTLAGLIVWFSFWGVAGLISSIFAAVVPLLSPNMNVVGSRLGMAMGINSIGVLLGSPIAGAIAGRKGTYFLGVQMFAGVSFIAGALCLFVPWRHIRRKKAEGS